MATSLVSDLYKLIINSVNYIFKKNYLVAWINPTRIWNEEKTCSSKFPVLPNNSCKQSKCCVICKETKPCTELQACMVTNTGSIPLKYPTSWQSIMVFFNNSITNSPSTQELSSICEFRKDKGSFIINIT